MGRKKRISSIACEWPVLVHETDDGGYDVYPAVEWDLRAAAARAIDCRECGVDPYEFCEGLEDGGIHEVRLYEAGGLPTYDGCKIEPHCLRVEQSTVKVIKDWARRSVQHDPQAWEGVSAENLDEVYRAARLSRLTKVNAAVDELQRVFLTDQERNPFRGVMFLRLHDVDMGGAMVTLRWSIQHGDTPLASGELHLLRTGVVMLDRVKVARTRVFRNIIEQLVDPVIEEPKVAPADSLEVVIVEPGDFSARLRAAAQEFFTRR